MCVCVSKEVIWFEKERDYIFVFAYVIYLYCVIANLAPLEELGMKL